MALNTAVGALQHSVIRVVRTATPEVNRRSGQRYAVDLPCRVSVGGRSHDARLIDMSDSGAQVCGLPPVQLGEHGTLTVDGIASPLRFTVRYSDGDALHVAFEQDPKAAASFGGTAERLASRRVA